MARKRASPVDVGHSKQGSYEAEAVETTEDALNLVLMPRYKGRHGVVSGGVGVLANSFYLPVVAAKGRAVRKKGLKSSSGSS